MVRKACPAPPATRKAPTTRLTTLATPTAITTARRVTPAMRRATTRTTTARRVTPITRRATTRTTTARRATPVTRRATTRTTRTASEPGRVGTYGRSGEPRPASPAPRPPGGAVLGADARHRGRDAPCLHPALRAQSRGADGHAGSQRRRPVRRRPAAPCGPPCTPLDRAPGRARPVLRRARPRRHDACLRDSRPRRPHRLLDGQ